MLDAEDYKARDADALAPRRVSSLLALGIPAARWGRPRTAADIRRLIREMSVANPLLGRTPGYTASCKLGIGQTTVAKYKARSRMTFTALFRMGSAFLYLPAVYGCALACPIGQYVPHDV